MGWRALRAVFPDPAERRLPELIDLSGQVHLVTGAGQGIGLAVAARLAEAGAFVLVLDADGERARAAAKQVRGEAMLADVTDHQVLRSEIGSAISRHRRLDGIVNNVGVFPSSPLADLDDAAWHHVVDTTLASAYRVTRAALIGGAELRVVVTIGSTESHRGLPFLAAYTAAKHGLTGLVRAMALELGPAGTRVIGVDPGLVDTESTRRFPRVGDADERAAFEVTLPSGRMAMPDDIARVVLFAVSDLAAFVSGVVIPVDGGELAGPLRRPGSAG